MTVKPLQDHHDSTSTIEGLTISSVSSQEYKKLQIVLKLVKFSLDVVQFCATSQPYKGKKTSLS